MKAPLFDTTINEVNPIAYYIYNAIVNLYHGEVTSRQITKDKEFLFERIPDTVTSRVTFVGSDLRPGFINIYFIVLNNGKTFLYLHGNAPETPLSRGGFFMDIDLNQINHRVIEQYLNDHAEKWSGLYNSRDWVRLSGIINNSFDEIKEDYSRELKKQPTVNVL